MASLTYPTDDLYSSPASDLSDLNTSTITSLYFSNGIYRIERLVKESYYTILYPTPQLPYLMVQLNFLQRILSLSHKVLSHPQPLNIGTFLSPTTIELGQR